MTPIEFRITETRGIMGDLAALRVRITAHQHYLNDPEMLATHMRDVRDHDVVIANLSLCSALVEDASRQVGIAMRITKLALPEPEPITEESPTP